MSKNSQSKKLKLCFKSTGIMGIAGREFLKN